MKVIFMGTPDFSVGTLEALIEAGHEVVLAVTQPDKPKGRAAVYTGQRSSTGTWNPGLSAGEDQRSAGRRRTSQI